MLTKGGVLKPSYSDVVRLGGLWRQHPRVRGCVGHWLMNENGGLQAFDLSGLGHTGTLVNGPVWTVAPRGCAIDFDPANDGIEIPHDGVFKSSEAFSVAAWVYLASDSASGRKVVCKGWGGSALPSLFDWTLHVYPDSVQFRMTISNTSRNCVGDELPLNTWQHLCATYDGQNMRVYQDGIETGLFGFSGALDSTETFPLLIGNSGQDGGGVGSDAARNWDGMIDEVRIAHRVWTPEEILSLATQPHLEFEWAEEQLARLVVSETIVSLDRIGNLDVVLAPATLASTGRIEVRGNLGVTLAPATLDSTGTTSIEGALDVILAPATLASMGKLPIVANATAVLADATLSSTGETTPSIVGNLDVTLAPATLTGTGLVELVGQLSTILQNAGLSSTGLLEIAGQLNTTLAPAQLSSMGVVGDAVTGTLFAQLAPASLTSTAIIELAGALDATLAAATLSSNAKAPIVAALSATLQHAILGGAGQIELAGELNVTLRPATLFSSNEPAPRRPATVYGPGGAGIVRSPGGQSFVTTVGG